MSRSSLPLSKLSKALSLCQDQFDKCVYTEVAGAVYENNKNVCTL